MYKDNKGFSMVEIVVVIALMAVVVSIFAYSFSLVTGQDARQGANNISTVLDKAKNYSLTKSASSDAYVEITKEAKGYFATYYAPESPVNAHATAGSADYKQLEKEQIAKKAVLITVTMKDAGSFDIMETLKLRIYYDRVSGAFKEAVLVSAGSETRAYCEEIKIVRGRTYLIKLYAPTGKHTLERIG